MISKLNEKLNLAPFFIFHSIDRMSISLTHDVAAPALKKILDRIME